MAISQQQRVESNLVVDSNYPPLPVVLTGAEQKSLEDWYFNLKTALVRQQQAVVDEILRLRAMIG